MIPSDLAILIYIACFVAGYVFKTLEIIWG